MKYYIPILFLFGLYINDALPDKKLSNLLPSFFIGYDMLYKIEPKFWDLKLLVYSSELSLSDVIFLNKTLNLFTNPLELIFGTDEYFTSLIKTFSKTFVL